jgi:hypothetical protein
MTLNLIKESMIDLHGPLSRSIATHAWHPNKTNVKYSCCCFLVVVVVVKTVGFVKTLSSHKARPFKNNETTAIFCIDSINTIPWQWWQFLARDGT